jgi:hypothetical protein
MNTAKTIKTLGLAGIVALTGCDRPNEIPVATETRPGGVYVAPAGCERIISAQYHEEMARNYSNYQLSIACADTAGNVTAYRIRTDDPQAQWAGVQVILPKNAR